MNVDPYRILNVSHNASNDEVKKAYRELSRKYHPDSYANNPLSDLAEEKFKEVQEAYKEIMEERENSGNLYSDGYAHTAGGGAVSGDLREVYNCLIAKRYTEALNILARIPNKTAMWYYYSAIGNSGVGNNYEAMKHAKQAVNMEPNNQEFIKLLNHLQNASRSYQHTSYNQGRTGGADWASICCDLWCADSLCECMGGDLCSCI